METQTKKPFKKYLILSAVGVVVILVIAIIIIGAKNRELNTQTQQQVEEISVYQSAIIPIAEERAECQEFIAAGTGSFDRYEYCTNIIELTEGLEALPTSQ